MVSEYFRCPNCGKSGYKNSHQCSPMWHVGTYKDQLEPTYGDTLEEAAERYVERDQWASVEFDSETMVYGIDAEGKLVEILVTMEAIPTYRAEVKNG